MRAEGATHAEIDLMLDELEELYGLVDDEEGKFIMAVLRRLLELPS